ncbi:MAG: tRNA (N6-threonylcarbamoyladenosine(37)-N6)-methyltransferase TrmO [Coriobacteriia bacterium]|jgi:tRNA-Thr(GGU) m(6)t(6)A37 methyltransferase TsaA|nr:tRNA (N6-threonylcarbamoyladenosine(37)-N6)-methyltransferase TrmO [Coriobacteriia bacterium]
MIPEIHQIGVVRSSIHEPGDIPRGGTDAVIEVDPAYADALLRIEEHSHLWLLMWFHQASRDVLRVTPVKINPDLPEYGVFGARAFKRPNPIALTRVRLEKVEGARLHVSGCDAIDGTPVLDIKAYHEGDCVFSPRAPYFRPASPEGRWSLIYRRALGHHQEPCEDVMRATRMAFIAEETFGSLTVPELTVRVEGSLCLVDAIQGITRARFANPRRLFFTERSGPPATIWETPAMRVAITDRGTAPSYGLDVAAEDLFEVKLEPLG